MRIEDIKTKEQAIDEGKKKLAESKKMTKWEGGEIYAAEATALFTLAAVLPTAERLELGL